MTDKETATGTTVKTLQGDIKKELRDFEANSKEFNNSVKDLHEAMEMKAHEWQEYMSKEFKPSLQRMHGAVRKLVTRMEKKSSEFQEYAKVDFWGE
ncbi:MAG: hypothetical protein HY051_00335 [Candidatus Aenigmarchaeota archaeon]|nr:hypothetical protein [Candidatus Aenigmarchaeota archaeon]